MSPKHADRKANSEDPDQTAPWEQSDQGLHCLPRPVCLKTYDHYGRLEFMIAFHFLAVQRHP